MHSKYLDFNDSSNQMAGDRLHKIKLVANEVLKKFRLLVTVVLWKGCLTFKQYIPRDAPNPNIRIRAGSDSVRNRFEKIRIRWIRVRSNFSRISSDSYEFDSFWIRA